MFLRVLCVLGGELNLRNQPNAQAKTCALKKNKNLFLHILQALTKSPFPIFGQFSVKTRKL
jgi:hypothetical protein